MMTENMCTAYIRLAQTFYMVRATSATSGRFAGNVKFSTQNKKLKSMGIIIHNLPCILMHRVQ
jgi:hypothetical protein